MSNYAPCASETSPGIAQPGSEVTRPLISLIVPVWNDEERVADLVSGLRFTPEIAEWVVSAVRPRRTLRELNRHGIIRLISCDEPSRGRQMNAGAAEARGSLLCFHHADSELRPEHLKALEQTARNDWMLGGAFYRQFEDRRLSMVWWEGLVRWGGFADIPLMEDIELSRRLRRLGGTVLLDPPIRSSPRRFRRLGNWRTTLLNLTFVGLYYIGIDPNTLHKWYYRGFRESTDHENDIDPLSRKVRNE